ncbi:MAG: DUF3299 domain-containing protein [Betaproteobacteria bacterium]
MQRDWSFPRATALALMAVWVSLPAIALNTTIPPSGLPSAAEYASGLLPERAGVVSWKTLANVEPLKKDGKMVPGFSREILGLDRADVKVQGYMIPLDIGDKQKRFLISAVPPHCQFCLPAGPDEIVEVEAKSPVAYTFDPIIVGGKFSVVKDDASGILYRITGAKRVDEVTVPR